VSAFAAYHVRCHDHCHRDFLGGITIGGVVLGVNVVSFAHRYIYGFLQENNCEGFVFKSTRREYIVCDFPQAVNG